MKRSNSSRINVEIMYQTRRATQNKNFVSVFVRLAHDVLLQARSAFKWNHLLVNTNFLVHWNCFKFILQMAQKWSFKSLSKFSSVEETISLLSLKCMFFLICSNRTLPLVEFTCSMLYALDQYFREQGKQKIDSFKINAKNLANFLLVNPRGFVGSDCTEYKLDCFTIWLIIVSSKMVLKEQTLLQYLEAPQEKLECPERKNLLQLNTTSVFLDESNQLATERDLHYCVMQCLHLNKNKGKIFKLYTCIPVL